MFYKFNNIYNFKFSIINFLKKIYIKLNNIKLIKNSNINIKILQNK
jgi:hypothetical protein